MCCHTNEFVSILLKICISKHFLFSSRGLSVNDYVELIWTTFAEFPGTLLAFFLIDWIGRKKTLALLSFSFSISILGVIECAASKTILIRFINIKIR